MDLTARRVDRVINRDTTGIECIKLDGSHLDGLHSARLEHRTTPVVGIVASTEGPVSWPPTTTHHSGGGQPRCWKVRELPHTSEVRYRLCVTSGTGCDAAVVRWRGPSVVAVRGSPSGQVGLNDEPVIRAVADACC